jgi:hypothetical protein
MLQPTHWLHVFLVSKTVGHHFWPRPMAGGEIEHGWKTKNNFPQGPPKEKLGPIITTACWTFPLAAWNFLFPKLFIAVFAESKIWGHSLGWPEIVSSPSLLADFQRTHISTYVSRSRTSKNSTTKSPRWLSITGVQWGVLSQFRYGTPQII